MTSLSPAAARSAAPPDKLAALDAPKAEAIAPQAVEPSFDIVTVDPRGQAVIAGRAAPGDRVRVLDGEKTIGEVTADERGEWVLVPTAPVAPGKHELSLEERGRDDAPPRRSRDVVALNVVSPTTGDSSETMAVLLPNDASRPARVLQEAAPNSADHALTLDTVQTGSADQLILSGKATPGAHLDVFAGPQRLGTAIADANGRWSLTAAHLANAGTVELRLTELAPDGSAAQRVAVPLGPPAAAATGTYIVARGNSLWVIARRFYGDGWRYTAIYRAKQAQIHDPDLIYPGQHFIVPKS